MVLFLLLLIIHEKITARQNSFLVLRLIKSKAAAFVLTVSLTAVLGSLFFSEIVGYEPCKLCWWQRIFMYPLPLLSFIALIRKKDNLTPYLLPMSLIGAAIAGYHYFLQVGNLYNLPVDKFAPCSAVGYSASCVTSFFLKFGYITIPMMSLVAFALISLILAVSLRKSKI